MTDHRRSVRGHPAVGAVRSLERASRVPPRSGPQRSEDTRSGLDPKEWTRELRHSFVSLLSDAGVPAEEISRLVGHSGTSVTELVYRHQIRPVIQTGATATDRLFTRDSAGA